MRKALMAKGSFRRRRTVRLAKAAEDCPHSKTLTRLSEAPLGSIATPVKRKLSCYSILGWYKAAPLALNRYHPARMLVEASRLDELPAWMRLQPAEFGDRKAVRWPEVRFGETPKPARETRALPGTHIATRSAAKMPLARAPKAAREGACAPRKLVRRKILFSSCSSAAAPKVHRQDQE